MPPGGLGGEQVVPGRVPVNYSGLYANPGAGPAQQQAMRRQQQAQQQMQQQYAKPRAGQPRPQWAGARPGAGVVQLSTRPPAQGRYGQFQI